MDALPCGGYIDAKRDVGQVSRHGHAHESRGIMRAACAGCPTGLSLGNCLLT